MQLRDLPLRPVSVDTEFIPADDGTQTVVCIVAKDLWSGEVFRRFADELGDEPPYPHGTDTVIIAHHAAAEIGSYDVLGWKRPPFVIDTFAEQMRVTNGLKAYQLHGVDPNSRGGLLAALRSHGLRSRTAAEKSSVIQRILAGPPYSSKEKTEILDYCQEDVDDAGYLLEAILRNVEPRWFHGALVRGCYSAALADFNRNGHPVDAQLHDDVIECWEPIKRELIHSIAEFNVYVDGKFNFAHFHNLLEQIGAVNHWPLTKGSKPQFATDEETWREMGSLFPVIEKFCSTQVTLGQMAKIRPLAIGPDGRVRLGQRELAYRRIKMTQPDDDKRSTGWGAYRSKTGRNQPKAKEFVMLRNNWWRTMITPPPGNVLLYADWASQEIAIAAYLSGDPVMSDHYEVGDFYINYGKAIRKLPPDATKQSHKAYRDKVLKGAGLGPLYGMSEYGLSNRIGEPVPATRLLMQEHRREYAGYWGFSKDTVDMASLTGKIETPLGWSMHVGDIGNAKTAKADESITGETTLKNWLMQATGGDILRVACAALSAAGIRIAFPLHDAVMVECAISDMEDVKETTAKIMMKAAEVVLGKPIPVDVDVVMPGQNLRGPKGNELWAVVERALLKNSRAKRLKNAS